MSHRREMRMSESASRSEDSESDSWSEGSGFRVRVSLRRFLQDERAQCVVWARRRRRVRWLLRRLRSCFPLPPRPLALLSAGCLLPPREPLAVLRHDDLIEVIEAPGEWNEDGSLKLSTEGATKCLESDGHQETGPMAQDEDEGECGARAEEGEREREGEGDALHDMKRRALALLEHVAGAAPPARRRRVRRRRRPPAASPSPAASRSPAPSPSPAAPRSPAPSPAASRSPAPSPAAPRSPAVVPTPRSPRAPRLVSAER